MSLKIFHDDNASFNDVSLSMKEFTRSTETVTLIAAEDYFYLGLYKPFQKAWFEFDTPNTNNNSFTVEYWDGTAWDDVVGLEDDSVGWTRSGFISWNLSQADWSEATVDSETMYWVRLKPSVDHSATVIRGVNMVFSTDEDLKEEYRSVMDFKLSTDNSFIVTHNNAKKEIVQNLRNRGRIKRNSSTLKDITEWDILEPGQIREASKFLVLSKIFFEISDNVGDKYYQVHEDYQKKYESAFDLFYLTLDQDDDGVIDASEKLNLTRVQVNRV